MKRKERKAEREKYSEKYYEHAHDCCIHMGYGLCNCGVLIGRRYDKQEQK